MRKARITYDHHGDGRIRVALSDMGELIAVHDENDPRLKTEEGALTAKLFASIRGMPGVKNVVTEADGGTVHKCIIVVDWDGHDLAAATKLGQRLWVCVVRTLGSAVLDQPFWTVRRAVQASS